MRVFVRSMWPVLPVLLLTSAASNFFARAGSADMARYALLVGGALAVAWVIAVTVMRWRHDTGRDGGCHRCGGPLGFPRGGKRMYGRQLSDYRRCWQCGKAQPVGNN